MTLKARMDAHKADFVKKAPPEVLAVMQRGMESLRNSGILEKVIKAGQAAPDFTLTNVDGQDVTLSGLTSRGTVVLGFYRGRW